MDAFQQISKITLKVGNRALTWAEMFPESDDPEMEFIATWESIRVPAGDDVLAMAVALGKERPLQPTNCISERYGLYVSIAGRLQELRPGDYINLPVERLSKVLGVDERTVSDYAQCAKKDGFISLIAKHHKPSGTAAKYVFHCERFNMGTGEELTQEESPHFHKDCKDSEDCKELEEKHDREMTSRTSEELERQSGTTGFEIDSKRVLGNSRVQRASKNDGIRLSGKREELKRQAQFLEKKKAGS